MHRVGAHVSDQTGFFTTAKINTFIQLLGNSHGLLGQKSQACGGFLLQCAGDKRSSRADALCAAVDAIELVTCLFKLLQQRQGGSFIREIWISFIHLDEPCLVLFFGIVSFKQG